MTAGTKLKRAARLEAGLCKLCDRPRIEQPKLLKVCEYHHQLDLASSAKQREKFRSAGLCVCGEKHLPGLTQCQGCKDLAKAKRRERRRAARDAKEAAESHR